MTKIRKKIIFKQYFSYYTLIKIYIEKQYSFRLKKLTNNEIND